MSEDLADKLMSELNRSPIVAILGVVDPSGAAGASAGREGRWFLLFGFKVWRVAGGKIQNRELTVRQEVSKAELGTRMAQIAPYTVLRIRARLAEQNVFGTPQGLLVELVGPDSADADLDRQAKELQQPVRFKDPSFGVFTLDRRINWFEGEVCWTKKKIKLHLSMEECSDASMALAHAHALWDSQETWSGRITDFAASSLLGLKNDTWLGEDEKEMSSELFKSKMSLDSITIHSDGRFEFWHDDGDLFWGHAIRVSGNLADGPTDAGIEG